MSLIIDGYNLLLQTSLVPRSIGPVTLMRARQTLVNMIANRLNEDERNRSTIVFDAKRPPPDEKNDYRVEGLRVLYAVDYPEADDLIEELIRADSAPKSLIVVSSDRRLQTAANRRRATPIASDLWFDQLLERRQSTIPYDVAIESVRSAKLTPEEISKWLQEFGDLAVDSIISEVASEDPFIAPVDDIENDEHKDLRKDLPDEFNPFPPGYGEDLIDGE